MPQNLHYALVAKDYATPYTFITDGDTYDLLPEEDPTRCGLRGVLEDATIADLYRHAVLTVLVEREAPYWWVAGILPVDSAFGPQAAFIRAAVDKAEEVLVSTGPDDTEVRDTYERESNILREITGVHAIEAAIVDAMVKAGRDGFGWASSISCVYGLEILALAARDLIQDGTPWNRDTYDLATRAWREAMGCNLHPDD